MGCTSGAVATRQVAVERPASEYVRIGDRGKPSTFTSARQLRDRFPAPKFSIYES